MKGSRTTILKIFNYIMIFSLIFITSCGGGDSDPDPDPSKSSNWDAMKWDQGKWK